MRLRLVVGLLTGTILLPLLTLADVEPPVLFEGSKLSNVDGHKFLDLGNFHGAIPQAKGADWHYWGAREPIMSDDWVVFPAKGEYTFVIKSKSDQFDDADTKAGVWAEFDVRLYPQKHLKKLAGSIADLNALKGDLEKEMILFKEMARADTRKADDWATSETKVTISEKGLKGQLAIWFLNDKWQPDPPPAKDRNLHILSMGIIPPASLAVQPKGKSATIWAGLKR